MELSGDDIIREAPYPEYFTELSKLGSGEVADVASAYYAHIDLMGKDVLWALLESECQLALNYIFTAGDPQAN